jgi:alpha-maltose-1-phosphate synthase
MTALFKVMLLSLEYPPYTHGGVATYVFELASGLGRLGYEVTVLTYTSGNPTIIHESNVTVHFISPSTAKYSNTDNLSMVQGVLAFNRDLITYCQNIIEEHKQKPHIIHYINWLTFSAAYHLSKIFNIPIIGAIQGISEPCERWWGQTADLEILQQERELFCRSDTFITVSHSMRDIIQTTYGVLSNRIHVVYNGFDVSIFSKYPLMAEKANRLRQTIAAQDEKIIIFAGRIHLQKGILALLSSASRVLVKYPKVRYLIVGESDSRDFTINHLYQQFSALQSKVKFLGKVPRTHLALLYQIADIAVIPSIYEPFGYAAIEAMAVGVPVIATNVGGLAEIIEHGRTGLLVPVSSNTQGTHIVDVEQLADAQILLLHNPQIAEDLGKAGQQHALTNFGFEEMVVRTTQIYQQIIADF